MKTIRVICKVPMTFVSASYGTFTIPAAEVNTVVNAPEWIKDTMIFSFLVQKGDIIVNPLEEAPVKTKRHEPKKAPEVEEPLSEPVTVRSSRKKKG